MSVAAEKSIPLSTAVRAFANERRGSFAYRARRLAKALDDGKTLDASLKQSGIRLPDDTLVALRMGAETGKLHESLKAAVRNSVHIDSTIQSALGQLAYLTTVLLFVGGTLTFFLIKIMPAFIKIFQDFHRQLPHAAILVVRYPHLASVTCIVAGLVLLVVVIRFSGLLRWDPPFLRRLWRHLDESTVLRSLALTVDRQEALPATMATLAERYPKRHIRRRLRRAAARAAAGANWCDALHSAGLLEPADAGVLQAAQRVGNLSWALNATADRLVRRFITRMTMLSSVGFPLMLLLISAVVCLLAISVFASLANLITGLA
jgi:type II secretory pathway component PulF